MYDKDAYLRNRDMQCAFARAYYAHNKDHVLKRMEEYYKNNRERIRKYQREWYKENKHKKVTRTKSKFEIQPNPILVFD